MGCCPICGYDKEKGPERAYRLGLEDGLRQAEQRLKLMQATNHRLWEELCRLDHCWPVERDYIIIPLRLARSIHKSLRRDHNYHTIRKLKQITAEQLGHFPDLTDKVRSS